MRSPFTQLYIHIIWSTWDRLPLITNKIEARLNAAIADKCRRLKCEPLAIGGTEDHIHLLIHLHPTTAISTLVKEVKGASSHLITHKIAPGEFFKWQGAYGAFTLAKEDVVRLMTYIENQKVHHAERTMQMQWEPRDLAQPASEEKSGD